MLQTAPSAALVNFFLVLSAGVTEQQAVQLLAGAREKLHARRRKRSRPHLDDKVCHL